MNTEERRATFSLAGIFAFRMLGLFMVLPVLSVYTHSLKGTTSILIGLALGIYGLTQALLQIPFGMLSDRVGRKPVIAMGLLIFASGSVCAAMAHSIMGIVMGRAIQGAGAVGSTILALVADLTRPEQRTKAMAIIGMIIGLSFATAMVSAPALNTWIGVPGIFWLTCFLALFGIILLFTAVPSSPKNVFHRDQEPIPALFKSILLNTELIRLNVGIFILHAILTATFIAIPIILNYIIDFPSTHQWYLYLPVLILAFLTMIPFMILAEKRQKTKLVFLGAVFIIGLSQLILWLSHTSVTQIAISLFIFFTAFTLLEAILPSLISKMASANSKGTALGIYSTAQFLGIFVGGTLGGWIYGHYHSGGIFLFCCLLSFLWLLTAISMKKPSYLSSYLLDISQLTDEQVKTLRNRLEKATGVAEINIAHEEGIAYLKVDTTIISQETLARLAKET